MRTMLAFLFGCLHRRYTFPLTVRRRGLPSRTYIVCLDCGKEFEYDLKEMRIIKSASPPAEPTIRRALA